MDELVAHGATGQDILVAVIALPVILAGSWAIAVYFADHYFAGDWCLPLTRSLRARVRPLMAAGHHVARWMFPRQPTDDPVGVPAPEAGTPTHLIGSQL